MPRKYYRRRKKGRRQRRNRRKGNTSLKTMRVKGISIIPDRMFVKLKYVELGAILAIASASTLASYRGNGAYDPNVLLGGHSPLGYDQWANLFGSYKVHMSSIHIKPVFNNNNNGFRIIVSPQYIANLPISPSVAIEQPYARTMVHTNLGTSHKNFISHKMKTKTFFGVKSIIDDDFGSSVNNIPNNQWFWNISTVSFDNSSAITIRADIRIVYWIEFFNRIPLDTSGGIGNEPFGQTGVSTLFGSGTPLEGATGSMGGLY